MKNERIFKINSKYIIQSIFSYLKYENALKISKYNKRLQKELDISPKDYTLNYSYKKDEQISYIPKINYEQLNKTSLIIFISKIVLLFYQIIYSLIYFTIYSFINFDIDKHIYSFIIGFNKFLCYFFFMYIILSLFFLYFDLDVNSKLTWFFLIINLAIYTFVFNMMIKVTIDNNQIRKNNFYNWPIAYDIILVILYFIVIINLIKLIILFKKFYSIYDINITLYLKEFKGIKIKDFFIDSEFLKKSIIEQKNYLLEIVNELEIITSQRQDDIVSLINNYRESLMIPKLKYMKGIPDVFINKRSSIEFSFNNIFRLKWKLYLFKYKIGDFIKEFNNKNKKILSILSIEFLNTVFIIEKGQFEYILVSDDKQYLYIGQNKKNNDTQLEVSNYRERDRFNTSERKHLTNIYNKK